MNIKSLLIFTSLSLSITSAAELLQSDSTERRASPIGFEECPNIHNSDLKALIQDYLLGVKSTSDLNNYIKLLQIELYDLIDSGEVTLAKARFEEIHQLLCPIYEHMVAEDQLGGGAETLNMIEQYIEMHSNRLLTTTPVNHLD